jgi:hypothetical protein
LNLSPIPAIMRGKLMRSLLLALIPGMAVAALAGQDLPQPAEVHYGYAGPLQANAWQVGMECYVPVAATRAWGWKVSVAQFDAKVGLKAARSAFPTVFRQASRSFRSV